MANFGGCFAFRGRAMKAYDELKKIPQWIGWAEEVRGDKATKIPKNPRTGGNAATNNPDTWTDVNTAWRAVKRHGWTGLGFVFTIKAGIVGVDLDHCFDEDGILKPWASDIYRMLDSFTEYSPSGEGLHILCRGEVQGSINQSSDGFEMYNEFRYFTMTGDAYGPEKPLRDCSKELQALYAAYTEPRLTEPKRASNYQPRDVSEKEIAEALRHIPKQQDYLDWVRVLMAVHDVYPNYTGVSLIESWSPGYRGEVEAKFKSFDETAKSGVTVATLFHMAKQHGWQPQRRKRRKPMTHKQRMQALAAA